jgi:predicted phage terminase large subunit-like protein
MIGGVRANSQQPPFRCLSGAVCWPVPMGVRLVERAGADRVPAPACAAPPDLLGWAEQAIRPLRPAAHHRRLLADLQGMADGQIDRLIVAMPPGSAKSTYCSVLLPGWWLRRHPDHSIIAACHTEALAHSFGRRARALVEEHAELLGLQLRRAERAAGQWSVASGGSYYAAGVRGPIVGRRADLVLIDDPVKNHAEADSPAARETLWQWFQADLMPRLKPGGRIVLVMTRWHEDDLGGRLLAGPDRWDTLCLPALAETGDPLGRAVGEPLWPEWENAALLARKRRAVGERMWHALFQQRPRPDAGTLFRPEQITLLDATPEWSGAVRAWDLAATEAAKGQNPDWTVGLKLGRTAGGTCVLDVKRLRGGPMAVEQAIVATAEADGRTVMVGLPQDPGQAGKQQVAHLRRRLAGFRVDASMESGSKLTRAGPVSAHVESGGLSVLRAPWTAAFLDELRDFPHGRHDDQVDALARAFALVETVGGESRRLRVDLLGR